MSFHTYMLRCSDGRYYVGHTDNLEARLAQHERGEVVGYTQTRRPVELVWSEAFSSRQEAIEVERQLKGWRREKKEALIGGDWVRLTSLARKSFDTGLRQAQPLLRTNGGEGEEAGADIIPPPAIVLVRPQLGENIGKAARAMLNFGLTDMRLVA
ncbi:MAG TPA: GIY-YIG nuclease family protein, partial [Sphingomonas sp.]|nr:GIY-YIG nuclease family protein [Sphingomonas sp.]